jgi:uridine kinase
MTEYSWSIYLNEFANGLISIEGLETYYESCQCGQKLESPVLETFFNMFATDDPHTVLREKEIANKGRIATGTVKNHRTAIYNKLGLTLTDENDAAIDPYQKKGGDLWSKLYAGYLKQKKGTESISIESNNEEIAKSIVIGISGGSCSGKSWLSLQFQELCPVPVSVFGLDGYYKNIDDVIKIEHTHDNPGSIDFDHALFDLAQLKAGQAVKIPEYDFKSQQRKASRLCMPASIILVEGVFSFSKPRFLQEFDFKVWIEADDVTRYQRRLSRDVIERGRDPLEVQQRYDQNVRPGYEKFIYPNRRVADITIHNDINSGSVPEGLYALIAYCLVDKNIFNKKV